MKNTLVLNVKDLKIKFESIARQITDNRRKLLIAIMAIVGIWIGVLFYNKNTTADSFADKAINYIVSCSFIKAFIILGAINLAVVLIVFLSGFSAFGLTNAILIPCVYGLIYGLICSHIYKTFSLNGVFFTVVTIVPFAVISTILLIISCNDTIDISGSIIKSIFFAQTGDRGDVKNYTLRHIVIILILSACSLLQAISITYIGEKILSI